MATMTTFYSVVSIISILLSVVGTSRIVGPPAVFVAISPGLPRQETNNHIREVAIHLYGLNASIMNEGSVVLSRDMEFRSILKRMVIYDEIEDDQIPGEGRIYTGYNIPPTNFSARMAPTDCVGYFVRLEWQSKVLSQSCLKVYPKWMQQLVHLEPAAGNLTLNSLAVPGSHNAGAYAVYDPNHASFVTWYRDCQEEDIYSQLIYGSRFLDIRPGLVKTNSTQTFWVFHSAIRTDIKLESVLDDVRRFLDEHKKEVVFVDFHEFPWGFRTAADYTLLGNFVEQKLGPYMLQYRPHMITLNEAVALNQRAVVTFSQDDNLGRRFLPGVNHAWADTDNLLVLQDRLRQMQADRSEGNRLYSAMAELTPQGALSVIFDQYKGGVRALAHRHNIKVMSWWRRLDEFRTATNILAMDYLTSSNVVDVCRSITLQRALDLRRGYHYYR